MNSYTFLFLFRRREIVNQNRIGWRPEALEEMRKNLLEKAVAQEIIDRANQLTHNSQPKWGTMNPTEMLHHCNLLNNTFMEGNLPRKPTTLVQRVARFLFLNIIPRFPHNLKIPKENQTKGKIAEQEFEAERARYIQTIQAFAARQEFPTTHPAFGNMGPAEWGKLTWMHMDHHLRQFGV